MSSSVLAWYKGQKVYLAIEDDALLFDGFQFVPPAQAKFVWLIASTDTTFWNAAQLPINEWQSRVSLIQQSGYICEVIDSTGIVIPDPPEVIAIPDPNNGECVCGVTCLGTDLQYVIVSYV
jgi:hypothetical protein